MNKPAFKLSPRAWQLLLLIDQHTVSPEADKDGVGRFWVPDKNTQFVRLLGPGDDGSVRVDGSGDASVIRSLTNKGLIINPSRGELGAEYWRKTTELGRIQIEAGIEHETIPFKLDLTRR